MAERETTLASHGDPPHRPRTGVRHMDRESVRALMNEIVLLQRPEEVGDEEQSLRDLGFRSLDFAELALRVEEGLGYELNFDAPALRAIRTVRDVLDFFDAARQEARGTETR